MSVPADRPAGFQVVTDKTALASQYATDNVMEKILEFNSKNPAVRIEADMLNKALLARAKARMESDRGFKVDEKLYPYLVELLDPSRELLEREAAK